MQLFPIPVLIGSTMTAAGCGMVVEGEEEVEEVEEAAKILMSVVLFRFSSLREWKELGFASRICDDVFRFMAGAADPGSPCAGSCPLAHSSLCSQ